MGSNLNLFPTSRNVSLSVNIQNIVSKPLEKLRYSTYADQNSIATNYFESVDINSEDNLIIEDLSINYDFNDRYSFDEQEYETLNTLSYFSRARDVIFTYITGVNKHSESIPLFYKHKKSISNQSKTIVAATVSLVTNSQETDDINYGFTVSDGEVFFNYKNVFKEKTGEYKLYFLTISYHDGTSSNEIINPVPAIEKASYDNLNKVRYASRRDNSGYSYNIYLPESKTLAGFLCEPDKSGAIYVKKLTSNSIYLKKPQYQNVNNEWHVEIVAGEVFNVKTLGIDRYHVPEFKTQPFSIEAPNLKLFDKDCFRVTEKVIKIPFGSITYGGSQNDFDIDLKFYDLDGTAIEYTPSIASVDEDLSLVVLDEELPAGQDIIIRADFFYKTDTFYYTDINFNPYQNKDIIGKKYHFYIKANQDINSIVCLEASESQPDPSNHMHIGSVFYEEDYYLEDTFSFYLENKDRFLSFDDAIKKNPYILQSKYGYGPQGQMIQKENIVFLEIPKSFKDQGDYTEDELYNLFKRKLKPSTNLVISYTIEESKIYFDSYTAGATQIKFSWEGPGSYKIYRKADNEDYAETPVYSETLNAPVSDDNYYKVFTDTTTEDNRKYWYKIAYNDVIGKTEYGVRCYV